jgi:hypothetical protein
MNFVRKHPGLPGGARLRPGDRRPARVQQCRGRLRLQRQSPRRQQPLGDEDELADTYQSRKCFAYGARRQGRVTGRTARQHARRRAARLPEPGFDRGGHHHPRPVLRYARRHPPRREARPRRRRTRLHLGPDHRQRQGTHAGGAGRAGDTHARTESEVVRKRARARLRRRAPDRVTRHQHHGVVGDDGAGSALGLRTACPRHSFSTSPCGSAWHP